jgi:hypothetical protein
MKEEVNGFLLIVLDDVIEIEIKVWINSFVLIYY